MRYAGFGRRLLALLIDLVILTPVIVIVLRNMAPLSPQQDLQAIREYFAGRLTDSERQDLQLRSMMMAAYFSTLIFLVCGTYCVLTESSPLQGTLGKRVLGLRVTDLNGRRIRPGRAAGRYLAHILSSMLWMVGFIMAAFTSQRQALHDILAGTLVVVFADKTEAEEGPRPTSL